MADKYQCLVHAYVFMTNHVHLLITLLSQNSISLFFQELGRQYVTYINKTYGEPNCILTPHEEYKQLEKNSALRQKTYRGLFKESLDAKIIADLRKGVQSGTPVGYQYFTQKIEQLLNCKTGYIVRGRPHKLEKSGKN